MNNIFRGIFGGGSIVPEQHRTNFRHFYLDVVWFGLLNGSTLYFISIYATRLGATGGQIGLLSAAPAIANLLFTLPTGIWLKKWETRKAVFWSAVLMRIFYILPALMPFWLAEGSQIWALIVVTFTMSIPGTVIAVAFNALLAKAVPVEWRGEVAGVRNSLLSLTSIISVLICGQILGHIIFPAGYQIVFTLGFVGAALSAANLYFIRPQESFVIVPNDPPIASLNAAGKKSNPFGLSTEILKGDFGRSLFLLFMFHVVLYISIPIFPLFQVNELKIPDNILGLGTSLFYVSSFFGSTQLARFIRKWGNHKVISFGMMAIAFYPALLTISRTTPIYLAVNLFGGLAWALVGGTLVNYLLDKVPANNNAEHLAWYNLAINAAILIGTTIGPLIAGQIGLMAALLVFALGRFLVGVAVRKWG
jgi:MFS family permease